MGTRNIFWNHDLAIFTSIINIIQNVLTIEVPTSTLHKMKTNKFLIQILNCRSDFVKQWYDSVTRNYFENLVRALENGLSDVDPRGACSRAASSKNLGCLSSKGSRSRGRGTTSRSSSSRNIDDLGHWSCQYCTYANVRSATICQMCQQRPWSQLAVNTPPRVGNLILHLLKSGLSGNEVKRRISE